MWEPLCTYIPHICAFKINHMCLRESFAFKVLSLILYHKVNIPKSSFTLLDEWECVSPGLWDIPSADKELIRTFFILQQDVISQRWCENSCFMSDLHPVFHQLYSNAGLFFLHPFCPHVNEWTLAHTHRQKPQTAPCLSSINVYLACNKVVCFLMSVFDALCCAIFHHTAH